MYLMVTYAHLVAGNLLVKTLVARHWPANNVNGCQMWEDVVVMLPQLERVNTNAVNGNQLFHYIKD